MHSLTSSYHRHPSMNQMGHIYNQIGCQFLICESCFLTATIFKRQDKELAPSVYWKGSLIPKAIYSDIKQTNKIISYRGVSIYRIQNGKIIETWHVFDGLPLKLLSA